MRRLDFSVALNRQWQLIKTSRTTLTQLTVGTQWIDMSQVINVLTYKCTRKPLLRNLFVVDRIFFRPLRLEDIQYCHS